MSIVGRVRCSFFLSSSLVPPPTFPMTSFPTIPPTADAAVSQRRGQRAPAHARLSGPQRRMPGKHLAAPWAAAFRFK